MSTISTRHVVSGCLILATLAFPAEAQRPSAPKLLPKDTLAYVRVADSREFVADFKTTSVGRLSQDEEIKPFIMHLYGSAANAVDQLQEQIGLSLDQILAIPQGELCFAVLSREEGPPALFFLMEVGDQMPAVQTLIERGERIATAEGEKKRTESFGNVTLHSWNDDMTYCDREGVVLICSNKDALKTVLETWDAGEDAEGVTTLADNRVFTGIMQRSLGEKAKRPQVTWYVDPIELVKNFMRESAGAQVVFAMFPALGLDGVKAAGGSVTFNTEEFDSLAFTHLMLDNPRTGVLEMLAAQPGDTTPEDWVPIDAAAYMTVNWDAEQTIVALRKLVDKIRGEGAFDDAVKSRLSGPLGIDFEQDVLAQIEGRFTFATWMQKPATINSGTSLVGAKLNDARGFKKTLKKILEETGAEVSKKTYKKTDYFQFEADERPQPNLDESLVRQPSPVIAIVGDYLLGSDSVECLKAAIDSKLDPSRSFADELDFKLISSRVKQHLGSTRPSFISFQRPEETMRTFYDLATAPNTRSQLEAVADTNPAFRALHDALKEHPLPPFSVFAKYLAPSGGTMVADQSGIHFYEFALKRE